MDWQILTARTLELPPKSEPAMQQSTITSINTNLTLSAKHVPSVTWRTKRLPLHRQMPSMGCPERQIFQHLLCQLIGHHGYYEYPQNYRFCQGNKAPRPRFQGPVTLVLAKLSNHSLPMGLPSPTRFCPSVGPVAVPWAAQGTDLHQYYHPG